eukprot:scaffold10322_cov117-Isochrysis_galbana.AAC.2
MALSLVPASMIIMAAAPRGRAGMGAIICVAQPPPVPVAVTRAKAAAAALSHPRPITVTDVQSDGRPLALPGDSPIARHMYALPLRVTRCSGCRVPFVMIVLLCNNGSTTTCPTSTRSRSRSFNMEMLTFVGTLGSWSTYHNLHMCRLGVCPNWLWSLDFVSTLNFPILKSSPPVPLQRRLRSSKCVTPRWSVSEGPVTLIAVSGATIAPSGACRVPRSNPAPSRTTRRLESDSTSTRAACSTSGPYDTHASTNTSGSSERELSAGEWGPPLPARWPACRRRFEPALRVRAHGGVRSPLRVRGRDGTGLQPIGRRKQLAHPLGGDSNVSPTLRAGRKGLGELTLQAPGCLRLLATSCSLDWWGHGPSSLSPSSEGTKIDPRGHRCWPPHSCSAPRWGRGTASRSTLAGGTGRACTRARCRCSRHRTRSRVRLRPRRRPVMTTRGGRGCSCRTTESSAGRCPAGWRAPTAALATRTSRARCSGTARRSGCPTHGAAQPSGSTLTAPSGGARSGSTGSACRRTTAVTHPFASGWTIPPLSPTGPALATSSQSLCAACHPSLLRSTTHSLNPRALIPTPATGCLAPLSISPPLRSTPAPRALGPGAACTPPSRPGSSLYPTLPAPGARPLTPSALPLTPLVLPLFSPSSQVDPDNGAEGGVDHGSGWWYEGGGLYRHVWLVRTHHLHVQQDGLFAYSNVSFDKKDQQTDGGKAHGQAAGGGSWPAPAWQGAAGAALYRGAGRTAPVAAAAAGITAAGVTATGADSAAAAATATLHASATVMGTGLGQAACVSFSLSGLSGEPVASSAPTPLWVPADGGATATAALLNLRIRPWSARSPALYTVRADVWASPDGECATVGAQPPVDSVSVVHGFRSLKFDADSGFFLNEQKFKVQGGGRGVGQWVWVRRIRSLAGGRALDLDRRRNARGGRERRVHDGWFTVDGSRWMVHGGWFTVDGSRWMVHGGWFTVDGSRWMGQGR